MVVWTDFLFCDRLYRLYTCYLRLTTTLLGGASVGNCLWTSRLDEILDDKLHRLLHPPPLTPNLRRNRRVPRSLPCSCNVGDDRFDVTMGLVPHSAGEHEAQLYNVLYH